MNVFLSAARFLPLLPPPLFGQQEETPGHGSRGAPGPSLSLGHEDA